MSVKKDFLELLKIARSNVANNPSIVGKSIKDISWRYLNGLSDEVSEVKSELHPNNEIYLVDELSDIIWDYTVLLSVLESGGWIKSAEEVLKHANQKYTERTPAFLKGSDELWKKIKNRQKVKLELRHKLKYKNKYNDKDDTIKSHD